MLCTVSFCGILYNVLQFDRPTDPSHLSISCFLFKLHFLQVCFHFFLSPFYMSYPLLRTPTLTVLYPFWHSIGSHAQYMHNLFYSLRTNYLCLYRLLIKLQQLFCSPLPPSVFYFFAIKYFLNTLLSYSKFFSSVFV